MIYPRKDTAKVFDINKREKYCFTEILLPVSTIISLTTKETIATMTTITLMTSTTARI